MNRPETQCAAGMAISAQRHPGAPCPDSHLSPVLCRVALPVGVRLPAHDKPRSCRPCCCRRAFDPGSRPSRTAARRVARANGRSLAPALQ